MSDAPPPDFSRDTNAVLENLALSMDACATICRDENILVPAAQAYDHAATMIRRSIRV